MLCQVPPPQLSSNFLKKAPAQAAYFLFAYRTMFKLSSEVTKTRNVPRVVKMRAHFLLVGHNHARDQDTRLWEYSHVVLPTSPLARQKFLICSHEGKHLRQH